MADTPKRSGPLLVGSTPTNVYAPSSSISYSVVRYLHVTNTGVNALNLTVGISQGGSFDSNGKEIWSSLQIPGNSYLDWSGFLPLATPDMVYAISSPALGATITIGVVESV